VNWQGLLVSVRDAAEAAAALEGGAAIIDVKEPLNGPLGAAEPEAIAAVARVVGTRRPWTMACGELGGEAEPEQRTYLARPIEPVAAAIRSRLDRVLALLEHSARPPAAVKVGLAGAAGTDWQRRLLPVFESLPTGSDRVAVAYADWQRAGAPSPADVIAAAGGLGCGVLLLDTFDKAAGGLFDCCPPGMPAAWVAAARAAGLRVAVAGRIAATEIPAAWALRPHVVALRSAVCFNGRESAVQADLVRHAVSLGRVSNRTGS
jgi:uncharacterized protein (UPF0264 family)